MEKDSTPTLNELRKAKRTPDNRKKLRQAALDLRLGKINASMMQLDFDELRARKDLKYGLKTRKSYEATFYRQKMDHAKRASEKIKDRRRKKAIAQKEARRNMLQESINSSGSNKIHNVAKRVEERNKFFTQSDTKTQKRSPSSNDGEMHLDASTPSMRQTVQELAPDMETKSAGNISKGLDVGGKTIAPLNSFFSRPISIYDSVWDVGSPIDVIINPWELWSSNSAVRNKLSNFAFFRGDLNLRISVSGTPFHYGRVLFSYQPFRLANDNLWIYEDLVASTDPGDLIDTCYRGYLSQAPGALYIDIKENQPVEIKLPFIFPKTMARLSNYGSTVITNSDPFEDLEQMGSLYIKDINPIAVANEDYASHISVNIYAWVDDIQLGTVTGTDIEITPEANRRPRKSKVAKKAEIIAEEAEEIEEEVEEEEEQPEESWYTKKTKDKPIYDSSKTWGQRMSGAIEKAGKYDEHAEPGPVSSIATAVGKAGDALSDVPYIGGFAKATSTIAKGVGKVASWFGFSKPLVLEKPIFAKLQPFANGSNLMGTDTAYKIACDPKQELGLRMDLGGDGVDNMSIKYISARESYLASTAWSRNDEALVDTLYTLCVTPFLHSTLALPNNKTIMQPTAMCLAAMPFKYWRGNIKFRIEFVCSKFHRGKAIIRYEPNNTQSALIQSKPADLNQHNTVIIDLQETQNIELTVGWTHDRAFCSFGDPDTVLTQRHGSSFDPSTIGTEENIGWIDIRPFNELVQPTDDANVPINIYVSCDDLEVAVPSNGFLNNYGRRVNFTESNTKALGGGSNTAAVTHMVLNQVEPSKDNMYLDHFGEKVLSFRSLFKRYSQTGWYWGTAPANDTKRFATLGFNLYPTSYKGFSRNGDSNYDDPSGRPTLFDFLRYSYMGVRGGFRHRIKTTGAGTTDSIDSTWTTLQPDAYDYFKPSLSSSKYTASNSAAIQQSNLSGTVVNCLQVNGGTEVELPYYSLNLYEFAFNYARGFDIYGGLFLDYNAVTAEYNGALYLPADQEYGLSLESASAEDFTFLRFQGASPFTYDTS